MELKRPEEAESGQADKNQYCPYLLQGHFSAWVEKAEFWEGSAEAMARRETLCTANGGERAQPWS